MDLPNSCTLMKISRNWRTCQQPRKSIWNATVTLQPRASSNILIRSMNLSRVELKIGSIAWNIRSSSNWTRAKDSGRKRETLGPNIFVPLSSSSNIFSTSYQKLWASTSKSVSTLSTPKRPTVTICKEYPMLFEAHDWNMDPYALEANYVVDTILSIFFRLDAKRKLIFSSFSPEICILFFRKQNIYLILFSQNQGTATADGHADSLQDAVHFVRAWGLPGIIARSQPLVANPSLVGYVKDHGLLCISWGELNDEPENARVYILPHLSLVKFHITDPKHEDPSQCWTWCYHCEQRKNYLANNNRIVF